MTADFPNRIAAFDDGDDTTAPLSTTNADNTPTCENIDRKHSSILI